MKIPDKFAAKQMTALLEQENVNKVLIPANGNGDEHSLKGKGSGKPSSFSGPLNLMMWLFIASVIMLFAALTSAYIVKKASPSWMPVKLPLLFWYNSGIILLSSATLYAGGIFLKRNRSGYLKLSIVMTCLLGIAFVGGQFFGWKQLYAENIILQGNPSNSFLYLLTGAHLIHLLGGIIFLFYVTICAFANRYTPENHSGFDLCSIYWHFLTALWIYLFIFLLINQT